MASIAMAPSSRIGRTLIEVVAFLGYALLGGSVGWLP